ncbi:MAG TPA: hypothetical protein VKQ05_12975 [Gemmatimonadales bacterium]|nr:hypothetical protein [Gemmatimonadales bacterium]
MTAPVITKSPAEALFEELLWRAWTVEALGSSAANEGDSGLMVTLLCGFRKDLKNLTRRAVDVGVLDELHALTVEFDDDEVTT